MEIHGMERAIKDLEKYLKKYPRTRLITVFKFMRSRKDLRVYGDWPILSQIAHSAAEVGRSFKPSEIVAVCRESSDPILQQQRRDSKLVSILSSKDELKRRKSAHS